MYLRIRRTLLFLSILLLSAWSQPVYAGKICNDLLNGILISSYIQVLKSNYSEILKSNFTEQLKIKFPQYQFRKAKQSDLNELQAFINRTRASFIQSGENLNTVFDDDLLNLDQHFSNSKSALFVITDEAGKIIGSGGFAKTAPNEVELRKIYLEPKFHGTGIGKAWVGSLVELAHDLGNQRMWLVNHRLLSRATSIYRMLGLKEFKPTKNQLKGIQEQDYWFLDIHW